MARLEVDNALKALDFLTTKKLQDLPDSDLKKLRVILENKALTAAKILRERTHMQIHFKTENKKTD